MDMDRRDGYKAKVCFVFSLSERAGPMFKKQLRISFPQLFYTEQILFSIVTV